MPYMVQCALTLLAEVTQPITIDATQQKGVVTIATRFTLK